MLEDSSRYRKHVTDDITIVQPPQFTRPLHNMETVEGTNVHLECRLQPVGDPTMRVDWFVNGRPVPTGKYNNLLGYHSFTEHWLEFVTLMFSVICFFESLQHY